MTVPIIAVVLRLGALYVLWWGLRASVQFLTYSTESDSVRIAAVTLVLCLVVAAGLWFYARTLAVALYPYETDPQAAPVLDIERLEVTAVQLIGVIMIISALLDAIFAAHQIVVGLMITGPREHFPGSALAVGKSVSAILTALLGLVLIVKVDGLLAILRKLRRLG